MARPKGDSFNSEKILAKITKALSRQSFFSLTLAQIASLLKIKPASLYNHFESLNDLKNKISMVALDQFLECLQTSLQPNDPYEKLASFMTAYREFALKNPFLFGAAQFGIQSRNTEVLKRAHNIAKVAEQAIVPFQIPQAQRVHALRAIRSLLNGFIQIEQNRGFQRREDPTQSFNQLILFSISGLDVWKENRP